MSRDQQIVSPKRHLDPAEIAASKLFPYYAGFSHAFVGSVLSKLSLPAGATVFDPWSGSGITATAAFESGLAAIGSDLNPAMVVVAKAGLASIDEVSNLGGIFAQLLSGKEYSPVGYQADPLALWFSDSTVRAIRGIENLINRNFVGEKSYTSLRDSVALDVMTPMAAFLYLALFRTVRRWVQGFVSSNPTWLRVAASKAQAVRVAKQVVIRCFLFELNAMCGEIDGKSTTRSQLGGSVRFMLANAERLPLLDASVDAVISSPPYCTRIDYAVATYVELAILRVGGGEFNSLRKSLTGGTTVPKVLGEVDPKWGAECNTFLRAVYSHASKASSGYYFKNHCRYFDSLYSSIQEVRRVLTPSAHCVLVVQNSYYKEIRNDIALVVCEMAEGLGMTLQSKIDFASGRSMVGINGRSKVYLERRSTVESVLFLSVGH